MSVLFISHSTHDNDAAAALRETLRQAGYGALFLDFNPEDGIPAGRKWEEELYANLRACQAVVVLCSERSLASKWCFAECTYARALGKDIFPVKIGPCEIGPPLTEYQIVDATSASEDSYRALLNGFRAVGLDHASALGLKPGRSPYPGLLSFDEDDAGVFFGRDEEIQQSLDLLNRVRLYSGTRCVIVLGASGSGKSSILKAGVLPRLRLKTDDWMIIEPFRPGQRPLEASAIALAASFRRLGVGRDWKAIRDDLERSTTEPVGALRDSLLDLKIAGGRDAAAALFIIDQAEEFLASPETAESFLRTMAGILADRTLRAIAVLTLRSDFFGRFQRLSSAIDLPLETIAVGPMPVQRLPQIVERPAERAAIQVEPELTRAIVEDAGPHSLPLVAFTLRELWESRTRASAPLTLRDYRERLGGLEGSIARAAEGAFTAVLLPDAVVADFRRTFLRMVRMDEHGQYTRRPLRLMDIPDAVRGTVEDFVRARLLVTGTTTDDAATVEIAHEALIRSWSRLRKWVDDDRDFLRWRSRLSTAIEEWERTPDALLRGVALTQASEYFSQRPGDLTDSERRYIQTSRDAHEEEQLRWRRAYEAAEEQRILAMARGLAAEAELARTGEPKQLERSALLATESMRRRPGAEADLTLRRALILLPDPLLRIDVDAHVRAVAINPDGDLLAVGDEGGVVRVLETATGREVWRITKPGEICAVAFSPDGRFIASGGAATGADAGRLSIAATGELVASLNAPGSVNLLAFSPDGRHLLSAAGTHISSPPRPVDPHLWIWDGETGAPIGGVAHDSNVIAFAVSADSRFVATCDEDRVVQVSDIALAAVKARMSNAPQAAEPIDRIYAMGQACIAISPDGRLLAAGLGSGVVVWSADTGEVLSSIGHSTEVKSVAFSADSARLALAGSDGVARVWQLAEQRDIIRVKHEDAIRGICFLDDDRRIATFGSDATARIWSAKPQGWANDTGRELIRIVHNDSVMDISVSSRRNLLASASWDGTVRVSRLKSGLEVMRFEHRRDLCDLAFSPDSRYVATGGTQRTMLWDFASGRPVRTLDEHSVCHRIVFSPDGRYMGAVQNDGIVWNVPDGTVRLNARTGSTNAMAFSPDGSAVAFAGTDGFVHVWEIASGTKVLSAPIDGEILAVAYSPDGHLIAASTGRRYTYNLAHVPTVWFIDAQSGQRVCQLEYQAQVEDLTFSPDGLYLLTGASDRTGRLWSMADHSELGSVPHDSWVSGVAFAPDGLVFATASGPVILWDTATRTKRVYLPDPVGVQVTGSRAAVAFSPDGTLVGTAMGLNGYVWRWRSEDLIAEACRRLTRDLTHEEWEHYVGREPYRSTRSPAAASATNV